jgi:hypothetical protein
MGGKLLKFLLDAILFLENAVRLSLTWLLYIIAAFALPSAMILNFSGTTIKVKIIKGREKLSLAKSPVAPKTKE